MLLLTRTRPPRDTRTRRRGRGAHASVEARHQSMWHEPWRVAMMLGLPEDTKVPKFRDRLCAANGWVAGTLRHNDIRAFGHTEVFYALGPKDTDGTARVSNRELADLRLGLADNWEEVRRGYAALIEKPKRALVPVGFVVSRCDRRCSLAWL